MKRLLCSVIVIIMFVSILVSSAIAGEIPGSSFDNPVVINWTDIKDSVLSTKELNGKFYNLSPVPAKIYVPNTLKSVELGEEDYQNGFSSYFINDKDDFKLLVAYYDFGISNLEEYADYVVENYNATELEYDLINNYIALSYKYEDEDDLYFISLLTESGHIIEFVFVTDDREEYLPYFVVIGGSIMGINDPE